MITDNTDTTLAFKSDTVTRAAPEGQNSGDCELCGHWAGELASGVCIYCEKKYYESSN